MSSKNQFSVDIKVTEVSGEVTMLYWNLEKVGLGARYERDECIALYAPNAEGVYRRVSYGEFVDDYTPRIPDEFTPNEYTINETKRKFNAHLAANYDIDPDAEHPLGDDLWEEVKAGMLYDGGSSQFIDVQDVPPNSPLV